MTLRDVLRRATQFLAAKGVDSPRLDAELLLARALGKTRVELYTDYARPLNRHELQTYRALILRRGRREPLAYILGEWGFRRLTLRVDRRALVPRPETEIVVERCLELLRELEQPDVLDVGVGSGAIALAIADEHPAARVTAIDSSEEALALARENAESTGLAARVRFLHHDFHRGLGPSEFDLVVSNPPYVTAGEIETLQPEVRDWEPRAAVVGNGATRAVAGAATEALRPGGWLVLETAADKATEIVALLEELGYREIRMTKDLSDLERVVEGRKA
ncbi:MAG: peptide chain release factor N(5)-glutamine methyltransferase [Gaiellaceae bacterium]